MKKIIATTLAAAAITLAAFTPATRAADAQTAKPAPKTTGPVAQWHIGAGFLIPRETDLNGGPSIGAGVRFHMERDSLYVNYYYSPTKIDGLVAGVDDTFENFIFDAGYMRSIDTAGKLRAGLGIQVHRMSAAWFGSSSTGLEVLGEYDFARHWTVRIQGSTSKKKSVRFGAYELRILRNL